MCVISYVVSCLLYATVCASCYGRTTKPSLSF
ncbi:TPA: EAST1 family heat-stable enterotoxin [Escherichia coli]|nr:EAST1 family heat-stable enterotoxin [Escherichia coli]